MGLAGPPFVPANTLASVTLASVAFCITGCDFTNPPQKKQQGNHYVSHGCLISDFGSLKLLFCYPQSSFIYYFILILIDENFADFAGFFARPAGLYDHYPPILSLFLHHGSLLFRNLICPL